MFSLLKDFAPASLPIKDEAEQWYEFAVNAEAFLDENQSVQKKRFLLTDLCELVQGEARFCRLLITTSLLLMRYTTSPQIVIDLCF
jgi:hypothetical protein